MNTLAFDETDPLTTREAKAFEEWTCFNVYGVFHFNRHADGEIGTESIYQRVAERFIVAASKRVYGRSGFRRSFRSDARDDSRVAHFLNDADLARIAAFRREVEQYTDALIKLGLAVNCEL